VYFFSVIVFINSINTIHAHNTHSWETYFDQYEKGEC